MSVGFFVSWECIFFLCKKGILKYKNEILFVIVSSLNLHIFYTLEFFWLYQILYLIGRFTVFYLFMIINLHVFRVTLLV